MPLTTPVAAPPMTTWRTPPPDATMKLPLNVKELLLAMYSETPPPLVSVTGPLMTLSPAALEIAPLPPFQLVRKLILRSSVRLP